MAFTATQDRTDSPERLKAVPASAEVRTYEDGLKAGRKEAKDGKGKGFISSLLEDLVTLIENSDKEKKKQLTAKTKTPDKQTVIDAFDAANDVTVGYSNASALRGIDLKEATRIQNEAVSNFMSLDPLVREGAIMVLYVRAEAEYKAHQEAAGRVDRDSLTPAA